MQHLRLGMAQAQYVLLDEVLADKGGPPAPEHVAALQVQACGPDEKFGAGLLRHWIRIQDDNSSVTQLTGDYKKGYDRLTGGLALSQFIGWQSLAADRRSNWLIGLEFNEGFTNTLRDWDFNERRKLDESRLDIRIGLRVAWTLPFYQGKSEEIYY